MNKTGLRRSKRNKSKAQPIGTKPSQGEAARRELSSSKDKAPATVPYSYVYRARRTHKRFPELPLDIFLELLQYLHPLELLHLARTTKRLRSILMRRSASPIWKIAFANVELAGRPLLPPCPEGMSEPVYEKFLFIRECDICLDQPDVLHAFAHRRVNYCRDCVKDKVIWDPRTRPDPCKALPLDDGYGVDSLVRFVLLFKDLQHIFSYAWLRQDYEEVLNEYRRSPGHDSKEKRKKFCQARQEIIRSQDKFCQQHFQCDI